MEVPNRMKPSPRSDGLRFVTACTDAHFAAMSHIMALGWHDTYPGHVPDDYLREVITPDHWTAELRADFQTGRAGGLLLCQGDTPVGCVRLGPARPEHQTDYPNWGELISFYVHPSHRSKGYGGLLMDEALNRLRQSGHANAFVLVLRENQSARRFYASHGFAWDGTSVDIPFPPDVVCVDLRYTKAL